MSQIPFSQDPEEAALRVPACDACKGRKIKCDRESPCSSCIASKIPCRTTKRAPEKRQRVHLSAKYGDELADVNRKLSSLTDAVATILKRQDATPKDTSPDQRSSTDLLSSPSDIDPPESGVPYEGDSSFTAQSKSITQALEATISQSTLQLDHVMQRLVQEAAIHTSSSSGTTSSLSSGASFKQYPELSHLTLPPMAAVLRTLRVVKESHHRFFSECPVETPTTFSELCQRIYFPADDFSIAQWVIVNCGLFYLFRDSDKQQREAMQLSESEIDQHSRLCDTNISAAVQRMRLLLEPNVENMEALVLAANVCMETAKASAGWRLTAAAARLCLDCGLHQFQSQDPSTEPRKKRMLFWFIYCMDRGMALSFGRVPSIPEYDIAASKPLPTDLEGIWGEFFGVWIKFSTLQGDIYSQLFSASSKAESQEVRTDRARNLADRLKLHTRFVEKFDLTLLPFQDIMADATVCVDVITYALMTLIYRNIPPPQPAHPLQFHPDCVDAARYSLRRLRTAWDDLRSKDDNAWKMFVNWTLVFVPFVAFIVVFGNTIAESNRDDLALLGHIVDTIEAATSETPAFRNLARACKTFYEIAQAFLSSTRRLPDPSSMNVKTPNPYDTPLTPGIQGLSDFSLPQQDWDSMLSEWDLGMGADSAREMQSFFEQYMDTR